MGGIGGSTQALQGQVLKAWPSRVKLSLPAPEKLAARYPVGEPLSELARRQHRRSILAGACVKPVRPMRSPR
jgi:hypothetical protein